MRTQQRALVKCQITSFQLRLGEIPLDQIVGFRIGVTDMSAMTSSFGQFKLAVSALFRLLQQYFFTESLILAQDERWRRA